MSKYKLTLLLFYVILWSAGCGVGGGVESLECTDLFTVEFCQSLVGPQGEPGIQGESGQAGNPGEDGQDGVQGEPGMQGPEGPQGDPGVDGQDGAQGDPGDQGEVGPEGPQGEPGEDGTGCGVVQVPEGALVTCGDDLPVIVWNGTDGHDGASPVLEVIDLCGNSYRYGEVLLLISVKDSFVLIGHYSDDKKKQHLVEVLPGSWVSTDGFECYFKVDSDLNVTY